MSNILAQMQQLIYTLKSPMPSVYQRSNLTAMLGLFLEARGYPPPQHSQTKSACADDICSDQIARFATSTQK
ncbi:hypothetical protein I8752_08270 [Nostocaceae cyanobacterium CENA369]|uniref:Uncharacterized protein n=1 Tax=Dendronalium phyllosphericum CENA369 TaxID=1725256 RepID=A0A8J7LEG5_9NOST|nr:hypothetical protein [Dendronalium phyllosphericum]MBH8573013.1 hypothetical protein [Dendronalium phyllosphericum CENA369]